MPSPPTLIAFAEKDTGTTTIVNGAAVTTASLTWQIGDVLVLLVNGSGAASGNTFHAPTNTGSGLRGRRSSFTPPVATRRLARGRRSRRRLAPAPSQ
jgi:hypothetical protein